MPTRGVYNQLINYNVVINIINKYIGQEWKNQMRCNIVYTKMEEERTWNLRKAKKWKSRAKKPAGRKHQLILKKEAKWTLLDSNPGPSGYLPNLLTHLWLRMPSALSRMLIILKKRTSRQKTPTGLRKKEWSGRSWTRTQDRPVMSRML